MSQNTKAALPLAHEAQDPNIPQRLASDPEASVWVNASAGTGKTKVLTDRLIRLMLPRQNGMLGTPPHRILCLTYTKAGAGEMLNRIMETLGKWAGLNDNDLKRALEDKVLGYEPTAPQIEKARALFAEVIDTPGGIKIMTIHSFCQSLLGRFPIEAALPPDFALMSDDEGRDLIRKSRDGALEKLFTLSQNAAENQNATRAQTLMHMLTQLQNSDQIIKLLNQLISQRQKITKSIHEHQGLEPLTKAIYAAHNLDIDDEPSALIGRFLGDIDISLLYEISAWLGRGTKKDNDRADNLTAFLKEFEKGADYNYLLGLYDKAFLVNTSQKPYAPTKNTAADRPDLVDRYTLLAESLLRFKDTLNALETCRKTEAVLMLGVDVISRYERHKLVAHRLDYDDLILKSINLVQNAPSWVMYKLDGGIDHILVDEAQDSNPDQWIIIDALIKEFFAGLGQADERTRTLFVVGDEKQSIFGFQGSDPDVFQHYRRSFAKDFEAAGLKWRDQPLNTSFRSVQAVLDIVDESFKTPQKRLALTGRDDQAISHHAHRFGQAGYVELWPLITPAETQQGQPWQIMSKEDRESHTPPTRQMALRIATQIKNWLDTGEILASTGQAIRPGDVMILVRNRTVFVDHLIRALKENHIPVSGVDRMVLSAQIIVQDLLALARFALLPDDDLSLACLLKSPLIGLDEEALFTLSYDRKSTLWESLKYAAKNNVKLPCHGDDSPAVNAGDITTYLKDFIALVRRAGAYDFFTHAVQAPCPKNTQTGLSAFTARLGFDCLDAAEEFISRCFDFDLQHRSSVQHFIHVFEQTQESIKREIDEGQNVVRIMTVHGSKGLQAPIVFLPDTVVSNHEKNKTDRFIWGADDTGYALPLWDNQNDGSPQYIKAREALFEQNKQEYERLLYVALTRAEDRLYIAGYQKSARNTPQDYSWYYTAAAALENHPDSHEDTREFEGEVKTVIFVKTQQDNNAARHKPKPLIDVSALDKDHALPIAFLAPPHKESYNPPRPLQPSRASEDDDLPALSPLKAASGTQKFRRGNLLHALLQFLPDLPLEARRMRAASYLTSQLPDHKEDQISALIDEVFTILEDPEFAPLFSDRSKAEVPLTGNVKNTDGSVHVISGQIDRLIVDDENKKILIVDYKTNRPAPRDPRFIPDLYKKQMASYRRLLRDIYADYDVKTYLLWTDYAAIMEVVE